MPLKTVEVCWILKANFKGQVIDLKEYRVTKYDPQNRNSLGHYVVDEWTAVSDIGREYGGKSFTLSDYIRTETNYMNAIKNFMKATSTSKLKLVDLELHDPGFDGAYATTSMKQIYEKIKEGMSVSESEIPDVCGLILRECMWGKLISKKMFVHFGNDYYMYIGAKGNCKKAIEETEKSGMFVEKFKSPYSTKWYEAF